MSATKPVKFGIVGYGNSSRVYHLPYILPNKDIEVYAFLQRASAPVDIESAKAGTHCRVDYPQSKHYQHEDDFFADPEIEVVLVLTREDYHAYFAERALRAGKHGKLVVEKPFTRTSAEADHLIALAKETGKILTVFQNRRLDADFQTVSKIINSGALGDITEYEKRYDIDSPPWAVHAGQGEWEPGKGLLYGLGSHTIDQALQLFGRPKSVIGILRNTVDAESENDTVFMIILQYGEEKRNLIVTIRTTVVSVMKDQLQGFVRGTKGTFIKYGDCLQEVQHFAGMPATDPSFGVDPPSRYGYLTTNAKVDECQAYDEDSQKYIGRYPSLRGRYLGYYENVVDAVRGKAEIAVKPEESRDGIRIMELARESHRKGVTVPWS
ncbi:hypothetical protein BP6252_11233 [Coleophoma cylindrospora]|uniref:Oxidoreductase n=1 Tax=Coleophoma cylindrospora TaxID=1849047 RepID=A0A3D8QPT2_9HELO|nr:hypothetical protein BP6252_11233 [Coleophoma cylindrospora]